jgi:hypothetical protein
MLFSKRVGLNDDFVLVTGVVCQVPPVYCRVVTNRLEKGTFIKERVLKIPVFLQHQFRRTVLAGLTAVSEAVHLVVTAPVTLHPKP